jgi:hypothetical protein
MRSKLIRRGLRRGSVGSLLITGVLILSGATSAQQAPGATPKRGDARPPVAGKKASFTGVTKVIMDSEDAMGMLRSVEQLDSINTMEFWATGASYDPAAQPGGKPVAYKTEYHANIGYNPPGYRLEITRTKADGAGKPQKTLEVVNDKYAWNESQLGAGLIPGQGVATPVPDAFKQRLLQLWILPYGAVKAAVAAEGQTKVSTENGVTVLTFPLSGALEGLTAKVTLDAKKMVSSVETTSADPALHDLAVRITYSDYGDYGEAASDLQFPKHIVETRDGHPVLELTVTKDDPYNPYEMFRTPASVVQAASAQK